MRRRGWLAAALGVAACAHGEPFDDGRDPLGPASGELPRRLTFNVGDDRSPVWSGADIVYSRWDPARGTPAQCVARIPVEGGTLNATWCPPPPTPADTFVSTWLEPTVSEDGSLLAFVWQRGARLSALAAWTHHLVVASVDSPSVPLVQILLAGTTSDFYNTAYELTWAGPGRVRFLAAYDSIPKVKGGGPERFTDTLLVPHGLLELDVATGGVTVLDADVAAYLNAADGAPWVLAPGADTLKRQGSTPIVAVGSPVIDLALVDGRVVAARGDTTVSWWDLTSGANGTVRMPGPVRRLTAAGGRRFVAEVEADGRLFGAPANLWLFELPPAETR